MRHRGISTPMPHGVPVLLDDRLCCLNMHCRACGQALLLRSHRHAMRHRQADIACIQRNENVVHVQQQAQSECGIGIPGTALAQLTADFSTTACPPTTEPSDVLPWSLLLASSIACEPCRHTMPLSVYEHTDGALTQKNKQLVVSH